MLESRAKVADSNGRGSIARGTRSNAVSALPRNTEYGILRPNKSSLARVFPAVRS